MDELVGVISKRVDKVQNITTSGNRFKKVVPLKYDEDENVFLKIVFVGSSGTGAKSSFIDRYVEDIFSDNLLSTIGIEFRIKNTVSRGKNVKLQLWDAAGQERFRTITSSYYSDADGFVVGYSIDDRSSFEDVRYFFHEIHEKVANYDNCNIMIIGNKVDLEYERKVSRVEGEELTRELGAKLFFEVSAKTGYNVNESMEVFVDKILENKGY